MKLTREYDVPEQLAKISKNLLEVKDENKNIKDVLTRLTEEMMILRKELVNKIPNRPSLSKAFLPKQALREMDKFFEFDADLKDEGKFSILVRELNGIIAKNSNEFIRKCWHRIMADQIAINFTWRGKKSAKLRADNLAVSAAIKAAFENRYPHEPLDIVEDFSKRFFHYAQDRINKKCRSANPP